MSADSNGNPYVINTAGEAFVYWLNEGLPYEKIMGAETVQDIGCGLEGSIWAVGGTIDGEPGPLYKYNNEQ